MHEGIDLDPWDPLWHRSDHLVPRRRWHAPGQRATPDLLDPPRHTVTTRGGLMSDSRRSASPAQVARSIQRTVAIAVAIAGQAMYRWLLASMLFGRLRTDPQDGRDLPTGSAGGRAAPV